MRKILKPAPTLTTLCLSVGHSHHGHDGNVPIPCKKNNNKKQKNKKNTKKQKKKKIKNNA